MGAEQGPKKPFEVDVAVLGGGCFWCLEAVFSELSGVVRVLSGYSGGTTANPTYKQVCSGETGHAEVVKITFEPWVINFREILTIFFHVHDPTTLNRQGDDEGTQYRSTILYRSEEQKKAAQEMIAELQSEKIWNAPFVTEIKPFEVFYKAEESHQEYYALHQDKPYCRSVISPKILKLRKLFADRLKNS